MNLEDDTASIRSLTVLRKLKFASSQKEGVVSAPHGNNIKPFSYKHINVILNSLSFGVSILSNEDPYKLRCGNGMLFIRVFIQIFKKTERTLLIADRSHMAVPHLITLFSIITHEDHASVIPASFL